MLTRLLAKAGRDRTAVYQIFSPVLSHLSYSHKTNCKQLAPLPAPSVGMAPAKNNAYKHGPPAQTTTVTRLDGSRYFYRRGRAASGHRRE